VLKIDGESLTSADLIICGKGEYQIEVYMIFSHGIQKKNIKKNYITFVCYSTICLTLS